MRTVDKTLEPERLFYRQCLNLGKGETGYFCNDADRKPFLPHIRGDFRCSFGLRRFDAGGFIPSGKDSLRMRADNPFVFTELRSGKGADKVSEFIVRQGMLPPQGQRRPDTLQHLKMRIKQRTIRRADKPPRRRRREQ
jgi:hypothetical protein